MNLYQIIRHSNPDDSHFLSSFIVSFKRAKIKTMYMRFSPGVLYDCKTLSFSLSTGCKLKLGAREYFLIQEGSSKSKCTV